MVTKEIDIVYVTKLKRGTVMNTQRVDRNE